MPGAELKADVWITEYITPWDVYGHGVTRILAAAETEFQAMQIVETGVYGRALVLDGKWQSCTGDEYLYHEPLVHPACVCFTRANAAAPASLLILGGGEGATLREALRWTSIDRATMVDIDGIVVEACKEHLPEMHRGAFEDARAEVIIADALKYVADEQTRPQGGWDVIVSDLSDPIEDGPSYQLFTKEYYESLKAAMSESGVLVVQAGPVNPAGAQQHARLVKTLRTVFERTISVVSAVPTYPAPWSFILASDAKIERPTDPTLVDVALAEHVRPFGGTALKMFDGEAMIGLTHVTKSLRDLIAAETVIYTKDNPPRFFGVGNAG
ncbi:MAG: spermidine synthase [Phycisphaerae bacterium]|nr:spermidine synthase [Phycisphaerae bacterium]